MPIEWQLAESIIWLILKPRGLYVAKGSIIKAIADFLFTAPSRTFPNLRVLQTLIHLIITIALRGRDYYHHPHSAGEEIETQREFL